MTCPLPQMIQMDIEESLKRYTKVFLYPIIYPTDERLLHLFRPKKILRVFTYHTQLMYQVLNQVRLSDVCVFDDLSYVVPLQLSPHLSDKYWWEI